MILEFFKFLLVPIGIVVSAVFSLIPDLNFLNSSLSSVATAFEWFFGVMASLDPIFPYSVQINILTIIVSYYALLFTFRLVSWVIRKIPFIGIS